MSIFQCDKCGCAENTSLGAYHSRNSKNVTPPEFIGMKLCSACAPLTFASGKVNEKFNGEWHGVFERRYLPKGEFFTNGSGNLEHKETGLLSRDWIIKHGEV